MPPTSGDDNYRVKYLSFHQTVKESIHFFLPSYDPTGDLKSGIVLEKDGFLP